MPVVEIDNLSVNAEDFAEYLQIDNLSDTIIIAKAMSMVHAKISKLLVRNLKAAIRETEEYNIPLLKGHLIKVFSNPKMIQANEDGVLFIPAEELAGSEDDFDNAMTAARATLGLKSKGDIEDRAKYWKTIIYLPARQPGVAAPKSIRKGKKKKFKRKAKEVYDKTIDARMEAWGNLAPYWVFLEEGNEQYGAAFPRFKAQGFVQATVERGQDLLNNAIALVNNEIGNKVAIELEEFSRSVSASRSKPGRILSEFFIGHEPYVIYITPIRKQLGVAKASSRERILRRALTGV